jgi:hypothetical protein
MASIDICKIELSSGAHDAPRKGACVMEAVTLLVGEPWGDHPKCVCPVIAAFCRRLNDAWWPSDKERTAMLLPLAARYGADGECAPGPVVGTRSTREVERRRMFMCADFAVRVAAPIALRARKRPDLAEKLEALGEIVDKASAEKARAAAAAAYAAAADAADDADDAAAYAAYSAAYSAADSADSADADSADAAADSADADSADAAADAAAAAAAAAAADAYAARWAARKEVYAKAVALVERLCEVK